MPPYEDAGLKRAQKYPYSEVAKAIVRKRDFSLDEVPEEIMGRAKAMVLSAMKNKPYAPQLHGSGLLMNEVLAYPLARVLISCTRNQEFIRRFALMFRKGAEETLKKEEGDELLSLAAEFGVVLPKGTDGFPVALPIADYLSAGLQGERMKLVNRRLGKGMVKLTKTDFAEFLSAIAYARVLSGMPLPTQNVTRGIKAVAAELEQQWKPIQQKYDFKAMGEVKPELFPPCMAAIYASMLESKNLSHLERFDIATFLVAVGMDKEQIISLFRTLPNFKEGITRYQIERISKSKYSSPSCVKIKSHRFCTSDCGVKHPMQVYRRGLRREGAGAKAGAANAGTGKGAAQRQASQPAPGR
ncbi:MAG: hypothetical protein V1676_01930 [Candidatus Diapherotrites archaeon]